MTNSKSVDNYRFMTAEPFVKETAGNWREGVTQSSLHRGSNNTVCLNLLSQQNSLRAWRLCCYSSVNYSWLPFYDLTVVNTSAIKLHSVADHAH